MPGTLHVIDPTAEYKEVVFINFEGHERFEFPHYKSAYDTTTQEEAEAGEGLTFPMLTDQFFDVATLTRDEEDKNHPIVKLVKDGATIDSIKVLDDWEDDHLTCVDVEITIDGKLYGYSDWWLSTHGYKMYIKAEEGNKKSLDELKEHITSHYIEDEQ